MNIRPSPLPSAPLDTVSLHPSSPYHSHHRTSSNPGGSSSSSSSSASNSSSSSLLVLRQHSDDIPLHMQHQLHNPNYPLHHQLQQQQNPRTVPSTAAVAFAPVGGDGNRAFAAAYAGPAAPAAADTSLHWYLFGYVSDLVVSGGLVALSVSLDRFFKPFERPFDPTDPDISHPIGRNIVNNSMLAVIVALVPLVVVAIANAVWVAVRWLGTRGKAMQRYPGGAQAEMKSVVAVALRNWHHFFLGLLLAVGLTGLITNTIKNWAGRLRPDFLARCVPDATTGLCTGDPSQIKDGRRSFPSGHASLSFTSCVFLAAYLASSLGVWAPYNATRLPPHSLLPTSDLYMRTRSDEDDGTGGDVVDDGDMYPHGPVVVLRRPWYPLDGKAWRMAVSVAPIFLSTYVAISRTQQYVHHPTDVIAGGILGTIVAVAVFVSRFPYPLD